MNYVDNVDTDEFSIHDLDAIMKGLGYHGDSLIIYYHFLIPNGDFLFGLRPLGNDQDLLNLAQYVAQHKLIRVFTEHSKSTLLTYFMDPRPVKKVVIEELEEVEQVEVEDNAAVMPTPKNQAVEKVNPGSALVSVSPEYNRIRWWTKDKSRSSCSKRLSMDCEEEVSANPVMGSDFDLGLYQKIL